MTSSICNSPIVIAMDFDSAKPCIQLAKQLNPQQCRLKVGKELFTSSGPQLVEQLMNLGFDIFLDLKFHDIPNTVAKAIKATANLGVWMVNVHASGGQKMMMAAREAIEQSSHKPILIAVTVLTSMSDEELQLIGVNKTAAEQVMHLANLAKMSGMDGVVCSAQEAQALKAELGKAFKLITPGIRPQNAAADDQHRIVTPEQAMVNGSDYLVIGRPITQADNPVEACEAIYKSLMS